MNESRPVIAAYRFRAGVPDAEIQDLFSRHRAALLKCGYTTDRIPFVLRSLHEPNVFVEVFDWISEEAAQHANSNPMVQSIWTEFAARCQTVGMPFNALRESARPFPHFSSFAVTYETPKPTAVAKPAVAKPTKAAPKPMPKPKPAPKSKPAASAKKAAPRAKAKPVKKAVVRGKPKR